jgi:hypothetical protein
MKMMYNPETGISNYPTIKEDFYDDLPKDDEKHLVLLPGFDLNYFEVGKAYQITLDPGAFVKKFDGILKSATHELLVFTYYDTCSLYEYKISIREYVERNEVHEIIKYNKE